MTLKKIPLRTCIGCGEKKTKNELISIIKSPKNESTTSFEVFEKNVKKDGRSAYICKNSECFKKAVKHRKLEKSFKCKIDNTIYGKIEDIINGSHENVPDIKNTNTETQKIKTAPKSNELRNFLGITKKSGNIVLGMDSVKKGILDKDIKLILITNDISDNSFEEISNFAALNRIKIFKISFSKDDIFDLFGKCSAIMGIKNENFIKKITEIINSVSANIENQNAKLNREECNI